MPLRKDIAVVLRKTEFSNTSRIYNLLSSEGKISVLAKGIRRLKGKHGYSPDLYDIIEIVWLEKPNTDLGELYECDLVEHFPAVRESIDIYKEYAFLAEIMFRVVHPGDDTSMLFDVYINSLRELNRTNGKRSLFYAAILEILQVLGLFPEIESCVRCDVKLSGQSKYSYVPSQGGIVCDDCRNQGIHEWQVRLTAGSLVAMQKLATMKFKNASRIQLSDAYIAEIGHLLLKHLTYHLEGEFKTEILI